MTDLPLYAVLDQYRRLAGFTVEDCWSAYFALGGRAAPEALQAFLAGQAALPAAETDIIAVAISEFQLGEVSASRPAPGSPRAIQPKPRSISALKQRARFSPPVLLSISIVPPCYYPLTNRSPLTCSQTFTALRTPVPGEAFYASTMEPIRLGNSTLPATRL